MNLRSLGIKLNYIKNLHSPKDLLQILANYDQLKATLSKKWIQEYNFTHILDIGANIGQFATWSHAAFPIATIHSFEALPKCLEVLQKQKDNSKANWNIHPFALGDENKIVEMHLNSFTPSSSLLRLHANHKKLFPFATESSAIKIPMKKLDSLPNLIPNDAIVLAKIDVQGFESQVITGGLNTFRKCNVIICEISHITLFQGQSEPNDVIKKIINLGFDFAGTIEQTINPQTSQPIFSDIIFTKKNHKPKKF